MKKLIPVAILFSLVASQSFAYEQINACSNGRGMSSGTRQSAAISAAKAVSLDIYTKSANQGPKQQKNFEQISFYQDWIVAQLNGGTLLRDQLADEIEGINNIYSDSHWEHQKEANGSECRQLTFSKQDVEALGFVWTSANELIVSFNVILTYAENHRDDGTDYGYRFNMKVKIDQNYTNQNYPVVTNIRVEEYPQFISKEVTRYPDHY